MTEFKILARGYVKQRGGAEFASSTSVLIKDRGLNVIIDPGMDRNVLLTGLKKQGMSPGQINYVVLTHTHQDHSLLAGIFEKAKVLDDDSSYSFGGKISRHNGMVPGTDIEIVKTPGHEQFHCSVLINTQELGKVAIAGDVFWWTDNEQRKVDRDSLLKHKDPYVKNEIQLIESRKKLLNLADYIIPGHGEMFKVER